VKEAKSGKFYWVYMCGLRLPSTAKTPKPGLTSSGSHSPLRTSSVPCIFRQPLQRVWFPLSEIIEVGDHPHSIFLLTAGCNTPHANGIVVVLQESSGFRQERSLENRVTVAHRGWLTIEC